MLRGVQHRTNLVARLVEQVGIAIGLLVEAGLLAQHRLGQAIDILIRRDGIGHQSGGDGKG